MIKLIDSGNRPSTNRMVTPMPNMPRWMRLSFGLAALASRHKISAANWRADANINPSKPMQNQMAAGTDVWARPTQRPAAENRPQLLRLVDQLRRRAYNQ